MEEAFRALLLGSAGVSALVGSRVSWLERPQGGALPAVVLHVISEVWDFTHDGPVGLVERRVQVDCYAATFAGAKAVARVVRLALNGHKGGAVQGVFFAGARDTLEAVPGAATEYRASLDFLVNTTE